MLRGIWGDDERYIKTYGRVSAHVPCGDGCKRDADGDFWFMGRIDDVMNVSGHRISTTEVRALWSITRALPKQRSLAGRRRDGQAIACYVSLKGLRRRIHRVRRRAARARREPARQVRSSEVHYVHARLRKRGAARSCARLLRDITEGRTLGDTTTLGDSSVVHDSSRGASREFGARRIGRKRVRPPSVFARSAGRFASRKPLTSSVFASSSTLDTP